MKATSKIFATLFIALGIFAAGVAFYGATHQWCIAALCALMAFALLADAGKKIDKLERFSDR